MSAPAGNSSFTKLRMSSSLRRWPSTCALARREIRSACGAGAARVDQRQQEGVRPRRAPCSAASGLNGIVEQAAHPGEQLLLVGRGDAEQARDHPQRIAVAVLGDQIELAPRAEGIDELVRQRPQERRRLRLHRPGAGTPPRPAHGGCGAPPLHAQQRLALHRERVAQVGRGGRETGAGRGTRGRRPRGAGSARRCRRGSAPAPRARRRRVQRRPAAPRGPAARRGRSRSRAARGPRAARLLVVGLLDVGREALHARRAPRRYRWSQ